MRILDRQQGGGLWMVLVSLFLSLQLIAALWEELLDLSSTVHYWQNVQHQKKELYQFAIKLLDNPIKSSQTIDYSWHYLGQYNCVTICQPDCVGTRHWLLKLKAQSLKMHWRVAIPDKLLKCHKKHFIQIPGRVLYYRWV